MAVHHQAPPVLTNHARSSAAPTQSTAGALQSLCWGSASVGAVLSAYFSGSLVQDYGAKPVFWLTAAFPLLVTAAAAVIPEQRVGSAPGGGGAGVLAEAGGVAPSPVAVGAALRAQASALWAALNQRSILLPAAFVFLWQATPNADTAMMFFQTEKLGFSTEFLGRIRLIAAVASLLGVGLYNFALKATPLRKMFLWSALLGTGLGMTQLVLITGMFAGVGLGKPLLP